MVEAGRSDRPGDGFGPLRERLKVRVEGGLLETALTHASFANEHPQEAPEGGNERLEFLGDAVLQFLTARLLYRRYPELGAGELTRLRAAVVSEEALGRVAQKLRLGEYLRLGRGEEASGGRTRRSVLADAFEAVIGAVCLSSGVSEAARLVDRVLGPLIESAARGGLVDAKTALQELAQAGGRVVSYRVTAETGPAHGRLFSVEVLVDGESLGQGSGRSKKAAEQVAAARALSQLATSPGRPETPRNSTSI